MEESPRIIIEPAVPVISPLKKGRIEKHVMTDKRKAAISKATRVRVEKQAARKADKELKNARLLVGLPESSADPRLKADEGGFESGVASNKYEARDPYYERQESRLEARLLQMEQAQIRSLDLIDRITQSYGGPPEAQYEPPPRKAAPPAAKSSIFGAFYRMNR